MLALVAVGCTRELPPPIPAAHPESDEPRRGGTLRFATFAELRSIDPASITDGLSPQILAQIFAGLDKMGNPFTAGGAAATGPLTVFHVRAAVSGDYLVTPNVVITVTPFSN